MLHKFIFRNATCAAVALLIPSAADLTGARAQDRTLTITRQAPPSVGVAPYTFTDNAGTWERVPSSELYARAPQYTPPGAFRIARGRVVPIDVDTADMRNVSIRGLRRGGYYNYFGSGDGRTIIINPSTRRISRVLSTYGYSPASSNYEYPTYASGGVGYQYPSEYPADYGYGYSYPGFGSGVGCPSSEHLAQIAA
jgi:hypothetical protein